MYYTEKDIENLLSCGRSKAYQVIRELNKELEEQGYITIAGKVPKEYFEKRFYVGGENEKDN